MKHLGDGEGGRDVLLQLGRFDDVVVDDLGLDGVEDDGLDEVAHEAEEGGLKLVELTLEVGLGDGDTRVRKAEAAHRLVAALDLHTSGLRSQGKLLSIPGGPSRLSCP